jgi:putative aminopeptidase FrvX
MVIPDSVRAEHEQWLSELTQLPTAAGREFRVIRWIERWVAARPDVTLTTDAAGNLVVTRREAPTTLRPIWITAHLDHPAFVVERLLGPGTALLSFRGGVMEDYFKGARVVIHDSADGRHVATLTGKTEGPHAAFSYYLADADGGLADAVRPGDVATWDLPPAFIRDGNIYTHACDDLAALAAALAAFDVLRGARPNGGLPRLLFTRAEEIGFIGAIAACRNGTIPKNARVINLENSRSFDDSPIGGGPIVRVGDRLTVFSPNLTAAVAKVAESIAGSPAAPTASQKAADVSKGWRWQRKLMAGGACESSVFCAAGYEATCICLPLGNYHNMADLAAVQAGTNVSPPKIGPEFISLADYRGLVDLLVACGTSLPEAGPMTERMEKLWAERSFVLEG